MGRWARVGNGLVSFVLCVYIFDMLEELYMFSGATDKLSYVQLLRLLSTCIHNMPLTSSSQYEQRNFTQH